jgi:hypothetical protein
MTLKGTFHVLVAIFGWGLFVYWWNQVLPDLDSRDPVIALLFIGATILATVLVTVLWVRYNIGIFRRKGPRKSLTRVIENHDTDFLGRRIERPPGPESLKTARLVVVSVEGDAKKYEVAQVAQVAQV